jgi:hypothetical protein
MSHVSTLCLIICVSLPTFSYAGQLNLSWGQGSSRYMFKGDKEITPDAFRLTYIHPTNIHWKTIGNQHLSLELEFGAHHWKDPLLNNAKNGLVFNPMWRYFIPVIEQTLFFGIGIGLAYSNSDQWMDRKLGSRLLFEDKFEVGAVLFNVHRVSFSVNHYSNANLADINHGANVLYLNYAVAL